MAESPQVQGLDPGRPGAAPLPAPLRCISSSALRKPLPSEAGHGPALQRDAALQLHPEAHAAGDQIPPDHQERECAPFPRAVGSSLPAPGPRRPAGAPLSVGGIGHQQGLEHLRCLSRREQLFIPKELIILDLRPSHQVALTLNVGSES